jgi:phage shock protein C
MQYFVLKQKGIPMSDKTLALSNDKMIAGVCGGIAEYFGWSKGGVRLVYVLLSVLSAAFPGLFVYIILWLLMPKKDSL